MRFMPEWRLTGATTGILRRGARTLRRGLLWALAGVASWSIGLFAAEQKPLPFPLGLQPGVPVTVTPGKVGENPTLWRSFRSEFSWVEGSPRTAKLTADPTIPVGSIQAVRWVGEKEVSPWQLVMIDDLEAQVAGPGQEAQVLRWPCALDGVVNEAASRVFEFDARRGELVSIEIFARRLGSEMDPWLRIQDNRGKALLEVDDVPAWEADTGCVFEAPGNGKYRLEIRDANYRGGSNFFFRLRIGRFPLLLTVFPPVVRVGEATRFEPVFLGARRPSRHEKFEPVHMPSDFRSGAVLSWAGRHGRDSIALPVVNEGLQMEAEPNNRLEEAKPWVIPGFMVGKMSVRDDVDLFKFKVSAKEQWRFATRTRSLGSACDLHLSIEAAHGQKDVVANHTGRDETVLTNTFAAGGEYVLRVEELARRGGPGLVYLIEAQKTVPSISVELAADNVVVPSGGEAELKFKISRQDYKGAIELRMESALDGIECPPLMVEGQATEGGLKFKASKNAKGGMFVLSRIQAIPSDQTIRTSVTTGAARRAQWPFLRQLPDLVDGFVFVSIRTP